VQSMATRQSQHQIAFLDLPLAQMTPYTILIAQAIQRVFAHFPYESHLLDLLNRKVKSFRLSRQWYRFRDIFINFNSGSFLLAPSLFTVRTHQRRLRLLDSVKLALQCLQQLLSSLHVSVQTFNLPSQCLNECIFIYLLRL
jgi:hypothetical protein